MTIAASGLLALIRARYPGPEWAVIDEIHGGTSGSATRRFDAVAFNCWPSRGCRGSRRTASGGTARSSPTEQQVAALQQFPEDDRRDEAADLGMHGVWVNKNFPGREDGIPPHEFVAAERVGGFRAGSYTGYGRWRAQLAELVGRQQRSDSPGPFMELTFFSDCEGVIGPVVSAKLAKDFALYQPFADSHSDEWFRKKYAEWRVAFETAADGGFVDFH